VNKSIYLKENRYKIKAEIIPLIILLLTSCAKWFFEGILDFTLMEAAIIFIGVFYAIMLKKCRMTKSGLPWLLFILNIGFSLLTHDATLGQWGRGLITILSISYIFFMNYPLEKFHGIMKLLGALGTITAFLVVLHFVSGDAFRKLYFPLLGATARNSAELYTRHGYYFGVYYNPHNAAGLISFAIVIFVIWNILSKKKKLVFWLIPLVMIIPLLMTGKKAIMACMILAVTIEIMMLFASRKQWHKAFGILACVLLLCAGFVAFVITHPEITVLNRFSKLFAQLVAGESVASSRLELYRYAIAEWLEHPFFGIGWRGFNALTTIKYHMTQSHEVNCDYLQWLCETGIVGFIMSMIPVCIMFRRSIYVCRNVARKCKNNKSTWIILVSIYIQIFTLIYAFVEIPFFDIIFFSVYIVSCIIVNNAYIRRNSSL